jgi:hypothetical protein
VFGRSMRNPFAFLAVRSKREGYLEQYVLRQFARGRPLEKILEDRYVRNRSTAAERARLLDRPEIVAAIGRQAVTDIQASVTASGR